MTVAKDFEEFFASFNRREVRYLIVGGVCLRPPRPSPLCRDMDILVEASEQNARQISSALGDFGLALPDLTWRDFTVPGRAMQLGHPPLRIDIVTAIDGVAFNEAWERRVEGAYGSQSVWFISREDLIANKKASGRKQDLLDLESLS